MSNAKKLFYNTLILTATSFLMRTVGVSFNVYLTNQIGAAGIGLFQLISAVYSLSITIGVAGIRLAATRLVVENAGLGRRGGRAIMRRCLLYGLVMGSFAAILLYCGSSMASAYWIKDARALIPLRILALSLPFISMSAALNGYFTAKREIPQYAFVQIAEQAVKIGLTVFVLSRLNEPNIETACAAIVAVISFSEIASFLLANTLYLIQKRKATRPEENERGVMKQLIRIAIPDAVGSTARSILLTIEHLLIPVGFRKSGSSEEAALATYGTIHGMVLPIVLYPSAILTSLSSLLIPELAEHNAVKNCERVRSITSRALHYTLIFSIGTAGVLFTFAKPLSMAIYKDTASAEYLRLLAPLIPVMYLDMTVDGVLKGLDQQLQSMRYNIYDAALCVGLVYFLIPMFAVKGYIFILFLSELFNFFLSMNRLIKVSRVRMNITASLLKPLGCIAFAYISVKGFFGAYITQASTAYEVGIFICLTGTFYFLYLYLIGSLTAKDAKWLKRAAIR